MQTVPDYLECEITIIQNFWVKGEIENKVEINMTKVEGERKREGGEKKRKALIFIRSVITN